MINTISSWVYGNETSNFARVVEAGSPGHSSLWGCCYKGIGDVYDEMMGTMDYPNNLRM